MNLTPPIHLEVSLALAYAFVLTVIALGIEAYGRLAHRRMRASWTAGFRYDSRALAWRCSEGGYLWLQNVDPKRSLKVYRADAGRCNKCQRKAECTDSDEGRVLEENTQSWVESAMADFHRVFSLMLLLLAGSILSVELLRHAHHGSEPLWITGEAAIVASVGGLIIVSLARVKNRRSSRHAGGGAGAFSTEA